MATGKHLPKYFCIGRNKTGTTSLRHAFEDLDFVVGDQHRAEVIADICYFSKRFEPLIEYCHSAQVFQDVPFSWPGTYRYLDAAFPGSKFILSMRDSEEQWYRSITRAHAKYFRTKGPPTIEDLKASDYVRKGWMYNTVRMYDAPDDDPYNRDCLIRHYRRHNQDVLDYFSAHPNDLLLINVAKRGDYRRFVEFLGVASPYDDFPWENKT
jgi:hypothetical protein